MSRSPRRSLVASPHNVRTTSSKRSPSPSSPPPLRERRSRHQQDVGVLAGGGGLGTRKRNASVAQWLRGGQDNREAGERRRIERQGGNDNDPRGARAPVRPDELAARLRRTQNLPNGPVPERRGIENELPAQRQQRNQEVIDRLSRQLDSQEQRARRQNAVRREARLPRDAPRNRGPMQPEADMRLPPAERAKFSQVSRAPEPYHHPVREQRRRWGRRED